MNKMNLPIPFGEPLYNPKFFSLHPDYNNSVSIDLNNRDKSSVINEEVAEKTSTSESELESDESSEAIHHKGNIPKILKRKSILPQHSSLSKKRKLELLKHSVIKQPKENEPVPIKDVFEVQQPQMKKFELNLQTTAFPEAVKADQNESEIGGFGLITATPTSDNSVKTSVNEWESKTPKFITYEALTENKVSKAGLY